MVGNPAGATTLKTHPHSLNSVPKLNSTPLEIGSAAISEHISAVGVDVKNVRPWIASNAEDYNERTAVALMHWCSSVIYFEEAFASTTRRTLGMDDAVSECGSRVLCIVVLSRKLLPIAKLEEDEFLSTWWQNVMCHRVLWESGVCHSDVNPSNLVVYRTPDDRVIGVFNDFDLSSIQDIPSCQERTGTVPFMALDLLMEQVVEGKVKHLYRHDAESFIWVLTWVCLCYECSVFIGKGTPLDDWLKVDAIGCHQNKSSFLNLVRGVIKPSDSHHKNWDLAQSYLDTIGSWYGMRASRRPMAEVHIVFQTWLEDKIVESQRLSRELLDVRVEPIS